MGLFDDIVGIAREVNEIKDEITGTVSDAVSSVTDVKDEAAGTVEELRQSATDAKDSLMNDINGKSNS